MPLLSMVDRQIKHAVFGASRLTLVAPCEWLRRRVSRGVLGEKQIEVIPCGVEPGRFEGISGRAVREKLGVPEDARVVLFAGGAFVLKKVGVKLSTLSKAQADYLGVPVEGPYKPDHYRY